MRLLIKGGKVANYSYVSYGDVLIEEGKIKKVDSCINEDCDELIDASGMIVMPGGVDVHTHFNLHSGDKVSCDDFLSGTIAAACGGTTCIIDHPGFGPKGCSLHHQIDEYHKYADENAVIDYSFHGVLQNADVKTLDEMEEMVRHEGIQSFKAYLTYDFKLGDADIYKVLQRLKDIGGILAVHCENDEIVNYLRCFYEKSGKTSAEYHALSRPAECEGEAVNRMIDIAYMAGNAPLYIVHVSTKYGIDHIKKAKMSDRKVYSETCPQYLLLDESMYCDNGQGFKYIMSPPLRDKENQASLWQGIRDGTIDVVATDHCPYLYSDKEEGRGDFTKCPNGIPGVEERIPLMFSEGVMKNRIDLQKMIEVCCVNPARIMGLTFSKGIIQPGYDADIVIMDPEKKVKLNRDMLHSRCEYTAYDGFELAGYPVMTISNGEIIVKDGEFTGKKGRGRFIKRPGTIH